MGRRTSTFGRNAALVWLLLALAALTLWAPTASAFHFPWDQGHDTFNPDHGDDDTDPGPDEPCESGSPFLAATGNFLHAEQDLYIKSLGLDIDLTRSYNSRDMRSGQFGHGWTFSYDLQIVETTDGVTTYAVCRAGSGSRERFLRLADGTYTAPVHLSSTLVKNGDGSYTLTEKDGSRREYRSDGRLSSMVDRFGNALVFGYDSTGFLEWITDANGRQVHLTRGANGKVASVEDFAGRVLLYEYDADGNLTAFTDAMDNRTSYAYDSDNNLVRITDARGNVVQQVSYDSQQRVSAFLEGSESFTVTYTPSQNRTVKRDSQGRTWTLLYDDNGVVHTRINPLGGSTVMAFDKNLNIASVTDENGHKTSHAYDALGNPVRVTDPLGHETRFTWDTTYSQVTSVTDPLDQVSTFDYDTSGNLAQTVDPAGNATSFTYDSRGELTSITDALGNATSFVTDAHGNLLRSIDPLGNTTSYSYDDMGNVVQITNARGDVGTYTYNLNGQLVEATDALGGVTTYSYDANGNVESVTDPKGQTSSFEYDAFNRLLRVHDALGNTTSYGYDSRGNVTSMVDAKGQSTVLVYDNLDRLIRKQTADNTIEYSYDAAGNLLQVTDDDTSLSFSYDAARRLVQTSTGHLPATVLSFSYDANGNRIGMIDPTGSTSYAYDAVNLMTSLTNPLGETTTFAHDAALRRTEVGLANGLTNRFDFNAAGWITRSLATDGTAAAFDFQMTHDPVGNKLVVASPAGNQEVAYDALSQVVSSTLPDPALPVESYGYDPVGNRATSHLSGAYVHDAANRLLQDDRFDYTYDANGNLTTKTDRVTGAATALHYDGEDQLIRVDLPGGGVVTYRYDGLGNRVEKSVSGQVTSYVYDGNNVLLEYDGAGTLLARYTFGGSVDDVISMQRGGSSYFYHYDDQGSTVGLSDAAGQVVQTYTYDAFGRLVDSTGGIDNPYCYTGRRFDPETGLYYYRARYYDPDLGRFIQKDPIGFLGGDPNLYGYVFNNPLNWVDPLGLQIGEPGFWESLIPFYGSGRQAINDFQCGRWGWGLFNSAMAISDAFLVGTAVKGIGKGAWKLGSHTWKNTRRWYGRTHNVEKGQHVHHWAIQRNGPIGRHVPDVIKNQPWNLNPMPSPQMHTRVHGKGPDAFGPAGRWWHGTPGWAKNAEANAVGRGANGARGDSDCNCN